jgi:hypothetical protein
MRRFVERALFAYGCATALIASALLIGSAMRPAIAAPPVQRIVWPALVHLAVLSVTFDRGGRRQVNSYWQPVFTPTPTRLRWGRWIAGVGSVIATLTFVTVYAKAAMTDAPIVARSIWIAILALYVGSSSYLAIHWAFRPANVWGAGFVEFCKSPLFFLLDWRRRRN